MKNVTITWNETELLEVSGTYTKARPMSNDRINPPEDSDFEIDKIVDTFLNKEVVDDFMEKSNIEDLEEVRMHFQFIDDMLSDMLGNIDLEDYVNYVVNLREENERF